MDEKEETNSRRDHIYNNTNDNTQQIMLSVDRNQINDIFVQYSYATFILYEWIVYAYYYYDGEVGVHF